MRQRWPIPKRRIRVVTALLTVALLVAACGGDDGDGGGSGEVAGDLLVVYNWTGPEGEAFQAVIDGFTKAHPEVNVELQQVPFEQTQALLTQQFVQGNPPDVAVGLPGIVRNFAEQGLLLELDDLWGPWIEEGAYTESLRDVASAGLDHPYSVYFKGNVNGLIWYDPAQLDELGVQVPDTWEAFTAAMKKSATNGIPPVVVGGADSWPLSQWADPIILGVAGPEKFNALARGQIGWDDPAVVESFEIYASVAQQFFPGNALAVGFTDATCSRAQGEFLFQNQGAFITLIVPASCDKSLVPGKDFTFFPMPPPEPSVAPHQAVSGDLFFGAAETDNKAATLALLEYLGSADAQTIWAKRGGYIAPNATVPLTAYPTEVDRRAAELWPRDPDDVAGYDLDNWIGGEIATTYLQALQQLVRDYDVGAFIDTMAQVDNRAK